MYINLDNNNENDECGKYKKNLKNTLEIYKELKKTHKKYLTGEQMENIKGLLYD